MAKGAMPPLFCRSLFLIAVNRIPQPHFFLFGISIAVFLFIGGCTTVSNLGVTKHREVPPEFHQKVGLYVHDRPERISYYGSASSDVSDLMSFHLQQVLPFNAQTALQEVFDLVEVTQPEGPDAKIVFETPDLAGYFEIKVSNVRYDYPEADRPIYRAEARLLVEFKTLQGQAIWSQMFEGAGTGFSDTNIRLTDFGRGAASALEEAFQRAVDEMEDAVLKSPALREYLRLKASQP